MDVLIKVKLSQLDYIYQELTSALRIKTYLENLQLNTLSTWFLLMRRIEDTSNNKKFHSIEKNDKIVIVFLFSRLI